MLIKPENRKKVQDAIASGSVDKLFTPKNSRNLNAPSPAPASPIIPVSFGNVAPLIGRNGETKFTVMDALVEAKAKNKILSSLQDADDYVLQKGGWYWTGVLFAYSKDQNTPMGPELIHVDGNGYNFLLKVPTNFQHLKGDHGLWLLHGYHSGGQPYYEFNQDTHKGQKFWIVTINDADTLQNAGLLRDVGLPRKNSILRTTNADKFPNGDKASNNDPNARILWVWEDQSYVGLLGRVGDNVRQFVYANGGPSGGDGVLVQAPGAYTPGP